MRLLTESQRASKKLKVYTGSCGQVRQAGPFLKSVSEDRSMCPYGKLIYHNPFLPSFPNQRTTPNNVPFLSSCCLPMSLVIHDCIYLLHIPFLKKKKIRKKTYTYPSSLTYASNHLKSTPFISILS